METQRKKFQLPQVPSLAWTPGSPRHQYRAASAHETSFCSFGRPSRCRLAANRVRTKALVASFHSNPQTWQKLQASLGSAQIVNRSGEIRRIYDAKEALTHQTSPSNRAPRNTLREVDPQKDAI